MKLIDQLVFGCFCLLLLGCSKTEVFSVAILSGHVYELNNQEQIVKVAIGSNSDWRVTGRTAWCEVDKLVGHGNDTLVLKIGLNISSEGRSTILTIRNGDAADSFTVKQAGMGEEFHYRLPVIFHVIYNDANDRKQNIDSSWLYQILKECNLYYISSLNSPDMNVEFVAATHTPEGVLLAEPGIERIRWNSSAVMDCNVFLADRNNVQYIWDLNRYINVFIYTFSNENVFGISHLPYTVSMNSLIGLNNGDRYLIDSKIFYPHSLCLNSLFVYARHQVLPVNNVTITLAHEFGHYLGLFHVFKSKDHADDYCADTQAYDREMYEEWLLGLISFKEAVKRIALDGSEFISYNVMDYDYSYLNRFTENQRYRLRHVLENSPLIPGPKRSYITSKSVVNMEIPEVRIIE